MTNIFHVVHKKHNDKHVGYEIWAKTIPFLIMGDVKFSLKRHEAYAICKLLNSERRSTKWADKFEDPYK